MTSGAEASLETGERVSLWPVRLFSIVSEANMHPLWVLVIGLATWSVVLLAYRYLSFGLAMTILAFALFGPLICHLIWARRRVRTLAEMTPTLPAPWIDARLNAYGRADELQLIAEIEDTPFEPIIVERLFHFFSFASVFAVGMALSVIITLLAASLRVFGTGVPVLGYLLAWPLLWMIARFRPKYFRIVPGRVDVMQFELLGERARVVEQWNMRSARVSVSFAKKTVEVEHAPRSFMRISFEAISEPKRFVLGLFRAAISTHEAPPLPDDQLLG